MNPTEAAKLTRAERIAVRDRYRSVQELLWATREPLTPDRFYGSTKPSLLELIACAGEDPRKLLRWLPARYDHHGWYADTLPDRRKLRDYVQFAIRRRGYTRVQPKIVDGVVTRIIRRAEARGLKPHCVDCQRRDGSCLCCYGGDYCYCFTCTMRYATALHSLSGA